MDPCRRSAVVTSGESSGGWLPPPRTGFYGGGVGGSQWGGGGGGSSDDPVAAGVRAAAGRLAAEGLDLPVDEIADTIAAAAAVLEGQPEPTANRAIAFWIETVAVAASARVMYEEEPLDHQQLRELYHAWAWLINSWGHPPP
jgi:hypothetical protein